MRSIGEASANSPAPTWKGGSLDSRDDTPGHVLIVEDDVDARRDLAELLEREGYPAITVGDGREAMDRLRSSPAPALILLDLQMPGMDGGAFLRAHRAHPTTAHIPVVLLSAYPRAHVCAQELGADDFLPKPVSVPRLLELVARHCRPGASR